MAKIEDHKGGSGGNNPYAHTGIPGEDFPDRDDDDDPDAPEEWCLHITRTLNGYVASGLGGIAVFEEDMDCQTDSDPAAMARLLYHVLTYFGAEGSRYDARRVTISVEPGDKYDGEGKPN